MKVKLVVFQLFVFALLLKAQLPATYYSATQNLNGISLKTALYNIIKDHIQYQYTSDTTDVWDILKETDRDVNNPDNVILIYSGNSVNAAQEYNNGNGWEREHVWAKVHGGFDTYPPAGTDVHHIRPINRSVNSARGSRWFANCSTPYLLNGVATGSYTSTSQYIWKPRNEDKGDIARMIFYMAVRYEGENGEPDLEIVDYIPANNNDTAPIMAKLSDLIQWHNEDTVDIKERNRNNIIYSFQHNRNPFIDHPEYVDLIWGSSAIKEESVLPKINIYPNPATNEINLLIPVYYKGSDFKLCDEFGRLVLNGNLRDEYNKLNISQLSKGIYFLSISKYSKTFKLIKK